jgi:hypothetical protein
MHIGGSRTLTLRSSRLVMPDRIRGRRHGAATAAVAVVVSLLAGSGCSTGESKGAATTSTGLAAPKPAPAAPTGRSPSSPRLRLPAAVHRSAVGVGVPTATARPSTPKRRGNPATGAGPAPPTASGRFVPGSAAYRTRVLVRTPEDTGVQRHRRVEMAECERRPMPTPSMRASKEIASRRGSACSGNGHLASD